jgi:hypothetical protein
MMTYGYLYGFIRLIKDTHHDEVFIEQTNHVIMRNNQWLYSRNGLKKLAMELGYNPYRLSKVNYNFTIIDWEAV